MRFIEKADLSAFSKNFHLLNNRKETMCTKRVCLKLSDFEIWYEVPKVQINWPSLIGNVFVGH